MTLFRATLLLWGLAIVQVSLLFGALYFGGGLDLHPFGADFDLHMAVGSEAD